MPYNLLGEAWIPVLREDGTPDNIRPAQIAERANPPVRLAAARPDFNGALIQFLIGLVQTAYAPRTEREWRKRFKAPPTVEELDEAFLLYEDAFNLDGDGPRFMQDYERDWISEKSRKPLQTFLMDSPGEGTVSDNMDHFTKEQTVSLSPSEAIQALLVYQTNVPHTGRYPNHAALRGACPTTAIIVADTLWRTVWLNVIEERDFDSLAGVQRPCTQAEMFPWLRPHSSLQDAETFASGVHAAQLYWGMPQRIVLEQNANPRHQEATYSAFFRKTNGIDYKPPWKHPLQPGKSLTSRIRAYEGWTHFSTETGEGSASLNVRRFNASASRLGIDQRQLLVFAYEKDGTKASIKAYHEVEMPLFVVRPTHRPVFEDFARNLVSSAVESADALKEALRRSLYAQYMKDKSSNKWKWDFPTSKDGSKSATNSTVPDTLTRLWRDTEQPFYEHLDRARSTLAELSDDAEYEEMRAALRVHRETWYCLLRDHALRLFDEVTRWGTFRAKNPRSAGQARRELLMALGKPLKDTLGISTTYRCSRNDEDGDHE